MTLEDYDALLKKQGGVCAICKKPPKKRRLHVDHNHVTDEVRGLLCSNCNCMIGMAFESLTILEAVIEYLIKAR